MQLKEETRGVDNSDSMRVDACPLNFKESFPAQGDWLDLGRLNTLLSIGENFYQKEKTEPTLERLKESSGRISLQKLKNYFIEKFCLLFFFVISASSFFPEFVHASSQTQEKNVLCEFFGYARVGFNTEVNPLQASFSEQGVPYTFTSIYTAHPNNWYLGIKKKIIPKLDVFLSLDSVTLSPQGFSFYKDSFYAPINSFDQGENNEHDIRIRDGYFLYSFSHNLKLWIGERRFLFTPLYSYNFFSPFDINANGFGIDFKSFLAAFSVQSLPIKIGLLGNEEQQQVASLPSLIVKNRKTYTLLLRAGVHLNHNLSLFPTLKFFYNEQIKGGNYHLSNERYRSVSDMMFFTAGSSLTKNSDFFNLNLHTWLSAMPPRLLNPATLSSPNGRDYILGFASDLVFTKKDFNLLFSSVLKYQKYAYEQSVYDTSIGNLSDSINEKTNSNLTATVLVQPSYHFSENYNASVVFNVTRTGKRLSNDDANALLITPMIRYFIKTEAKNTYYPNIYTSLTLGFYDGKVKRTPRNDPTDKLFSTQTGFEFIF
ncbi:MAG: hypothetical protein K2X39_08720 [Silvanigrellaceae bacterium]|nr:hypothetical protein [Silvanigrellaceae bacterium]